jgi:hypothetical protein
VGGAGPCEESEGKDKVADQVEDEDIADDSIRIGTPGGGGIKVIEINGEGNDSDLKEVEDAKGIEADGVLIGGREEDHEDWGGPEEIENVGGPRKLRGRGNEALVIGSDGLGQGFESKSSGEKEPKLARVAGGSPGNIEGASSGEEGHDKVEAIGNQEFGVDKRNEYDIEGKKKHREKRGEKCESRELAGG